MENNKLVEFVEKQKKIYAGKGFVLYVLDKNQKIDTKKVKENLEILGLSKLPLKKIYYENYEEELKDLEFNYSPFFLHFTSENEQIEYALLS
jgi:hypothetical protein